MPCIFLATFIPALDTLSCVANGCWKTEYKCQAKSPFDSTNFSTAAFP